MDERIVSLSKQLAYVLRHRPDSIGLSLDSAGWADVDDLLAAMSSAGTEIDEDDLAAILHPSAKRRYEIRDGRIRAAQGHSIEVDLELEPSAPPEVLYHGTVERFLPAIRREGLRSGRRNHVHLSGTIAAARDVGGRRGRPVVLAVEARRMHDAGHRFYVATNGVWLVAAVPADYIAAPTN